MDGPASSLISTYSTETDTYRTHASKTSNEPISKPAVYARTLKRPDSVAHLAGASFIGRRKDSLLNYISHAFALGPKTNYLFAFILGVNLLMSTLNTLLLSFVVRSLQSEGLGLLEGKYLTLDDASNGAFIGNKAQQQQQQQQQQQRLSVGVQFELPFYLLRDKSILAKSIGHKQAKNDALSIVSWPNDEGDDKIVLSSGGAIRQWRPELGDKATFGSATNRNKKWPKLFESEQNHMSLSSDGVEIKTKSLVMNVLPSTTTGERSNYESNQNERAAIKHSSGGLNGLRPSFNHQLPASSLMASNKSLKEHATSKQRQMARRLLEYDAEQQSITLPLLNRFNLLLLSSSVVGRFGPEPKSANWPAGINNSGTHLIVDEQLNCGSELSGTLEHNFDVQSSKLSCKADAALNMVSRSAGVNLVAGEQMLISASQVIFSAPKTNKIYLLDAIECYDEMPASEQQTQDKYIANNNNNNNNDDDDQEHKKSATSLQALDLVLVDGLLMASAS